MHVFRRAISTLLACSTVVLACGASPEAEDSRSIAQRATAAMSIDSLAGPVTDNEIASFKSYIQTIEPVVWPNTGNMQNQYAQAVSGEQIKAMGLMYELSGDRAILDRMIYFCDTLLSERNDLLAAPYGQRQCWNGAIAPVWPGNNSGVASADSGNGDCVGHIANCARLILETPAIWASKVESGDPKGYGATYLARAKTFVKQADHTVDAFFFPDLLDTTAGDLLKFSARSPYQPGNLLPWNQQMMMIYGFYNLAWAHEILGDDAPRAAHYDAIVNANLGRFFSDASVSSSYKDKAGNTAYDWAYAPSASSGEDSNHGSLDAAGFSRAFASGRYGISAAMMKPFANMFVDVMTIKPNTLYAGTVAGCTTCTGHAATTPYVRSGFLLLAEFRPDAYASMMSGARLSAGSTTGSIDAFSRGMWVKFRRSGAPSPLVAGPLVDGGSPTPSNDSGVPTDSGVDSGEMSAAGSSDEPIAGAAGAAGAGGGIGIGQAGAPDVSSASGAAAGDTSAPGATGCACSLAAPQAPHFLALSGVAACLAFAARRKQRRVNPLRSLGDWVDGHEPRRTAAKPSASRFARENQYETARPMGVKRLSVLPLQYKS